MSITAVFDTAAVSASFDGAPTNAAFPRTEVSASFAQGATGPIGPQGPPGPAGSQGPTGPSGTADATAYANVAAFPGDAADGALGYAEDTDTLYVRRDGAWKIVLLETALSSSTPQPTGTAGAAGSGTSASKDDHVHALSAHASTHGSAGSDPITIAQSQVTGLTSDLAGKFDTPGAWTSYTPTVTAASGTFTSVSATAQWTRVGRMIHVNAAIVITTNGTAAGSVRFTLPVLSGTTPTTGSWQGAGREGGVTGSNLSVSVSSSSDIAVVRLYNNNYPGQNGAVLQVSITYQSAT